MNQPNPDSNDEPAGARRTPEDSPGKTAPPPQARDPVIAALFDQREQAEIALSDLERSGFPSNKIGLAFPANGKRTPRRPAARKKERAVLVPAAPTTGFPGWTMAMAPWVMTGVAPLVVQGSLSLAGRKDRPADLHALASSLGLREEATEQLRAAFKRKSVLVTVEAKEQEVIATHILERNGGHPLPRK